MNWLSAILISVITGSILTVISFIRSKDLAVLLAYLWGIAVMAYLCGGVVK